MDMEQAQHQYESRNPRSLQWSAAPGASTYREPGDWQKNPLLGSGGLLANALGLFSIGLGLAEVFAPRTVARWIGASDHRDNMAMVRAVGLRELITGIGILSNVRPALWLKSRLAGDAMDLLLLGTAFSSRPAHQEQIAKAMAAVAGRAMLDVLANQQLDDQYEHSEQYPASPDAIPPSVRYQRGIHVTKSITINRPAAELYAFWRNFENLPRFMNHLEKVELIDDQRSHWRAKAPAGMTVAWDAAIIDDTPSERISWRSLEGADVPNAGSVRFQPAPGGQGTVVRVEMEYEPPGGAIGAAIAKLFGEEPDQQVENDLHRFKRVMEAGKNAG